MSLTPDRMAEIVEPYGTVADRIRALAAAGAPRAEIARFLGKRYQHVRNVLEGDEQRASGGYRLGRADLSGLREEPARRHLPEDPAIEPRGGGAYWLRVGDDGRLPLPAELVDALAATPGERVFAEVREGRVQLMSGEAAWREARQRIQKFLPKDGKGVERFLAWRRRAWERRQDDE